MVLIVAMCLFSLSMSITPGPVNFVCLSSGVHYGFKRSLPFVSGATAGLAVLLIAIGLGLGVIANETADFLNVLKYLGSSFICYMGIKVLLANNNPQVKTRACKTPTFKQGVLLQWFNPKAWMACLAGTTAFDVINSNERLVLFVGIYFAICYFSIACWALLGDKVSTWLTTPQYMKIFNIIMGASLFIVAAYLLLI